MAYLRSSPLLVLLLLILFAAPAVAADPPPASATKVELDGLRSDLLLKADTVWVMIAAFMVFFMNLGFGCVESGFCRAKNCVNILSKNFVVFAAASIAFWVIGFGLMFGNGGPWFGKDGMFFVSGGADKETASAAAVANLIKDNIKAKSGVDLSDKETAAKNEELLKKIEEEAATAYAKIAAEEEALKKDAEGEKTAKKDGKSYTATYKKENAASTIKLKVGDKEVETKVGWDEFYWDNYSSLGWTTVPLWAKFFFQLVFAGTAATIVSGAVAERIKYSSFIVFTFLLTIFIYPIVGHWIWGGGLLAPGEANFFGPDKGLFDFAGSSVVHSVGGWAALAGVIVLGPRIGKFGPDGKINAIPGHNMTAAFIGCLVLWFGWFGFNPGSTMAADVHGITRVAMTTNTGAIFATMTATITAWLLLGKPDIGMTLNGCLAGLVAVTAPCAFISVGSAAIIGSIAGVLVVLSVMFFDKIRIDDPVGATSVHLANGIFGTIAVGLWGQKELIVNGSRIATGLPNDGFFFGGGLNQLGPQVIGVLIVGAYAFPVALVIWTILKLTLGIRVSAAEETEGLDIGEHGNEAYHGFVMAGAEAVYPPVEPKSATVPPVEGKRFKVVVEGADPTALNEVWSSLCQPQKNGVSPEFKAVYPYLTTMQGTTFRFRGGDPETIKSNLERLLKPLGNGSKGVRVRVES